MTYIKIVNLEEVFPYKTINLPFKWKGKENRNRTEITCKLFQECCNKVLDKIKEDPYPYLKYGKSKYISNLRSIGYEILPYKYYVDGAIELVYDNVKSLLELSNYFIEECEDPIEWTVTKLLELEYEDLTMFQSIGDKYKLGNLGIRITKELSKVEVTLFSNDSEYSKFTLPVKIPKQRLTIVQELVDLAYNKQLGYLARVYVDYFVGKYVIGKVQVCVPYWLWFKHLKKNDDTFVFDSVIGFDVNQDRINWCLIKPYEPFEVINVGTIWFKNLVTRNFNVYRLRTTVRKYLHKLFVEIVFLKRYRPLVVLEDPSKLGLLKLEWIKFKERKSARYNFNVMTFKSKFIWEIAELSRLYGLDFFFINPSGTSKLAEEIKNYFGWDRQRTTSYIIAVIGTTTLLE